MFHRWSGRRWPLWGCREKEYSPRQRCTSFPTILSSYCAVLAAVVNPHRQGYQAHGGGKTEEMRVRAGRMQHTRREASGRALDGCRTCRTVRRVFQGGTCMRGAHACARRAGDRTSSGVPRTRLVACVYASRDRTASASWRKPRMSGRHGACGLRERAGTKAGRGTPEVGHGCGAHGGWWRRRLTECN